MPINFTPKRRSLALKYLDIKDKLEVKKVFVDNFYKQAKIKIDKYDREKL